MGGDPLTTANFRAFAKDALGPIIDEVVRNALREELQLGYQDGYSPSPPVAHATTTDSRAKSKFRGEHSNAFDTTATTDTRFKYKKERAGSQLISSPSQMQLMDNAEQAKVNTEATSTRVEESADQLQIGRRPGKRRVTRTQTAMSGKTSIHSNVSRVGYESYSPLIDEDQTEIETYGDVNSEYSGEWELESQAPGHYRRKSKRKSTKQPLVKEEPPNLWICTMSGKELANSYRFGFITGIMVLVNALCIGFDTDYKMKHNGRSAEFTSISEAVFCIYFSWELAIRIYAHRCAFFCGESQAWNLFDFGLVGMQVAEQGMIIFSSRNIEMQHYTMLRMLRILRAVRVVRLVRVFNLFDELRQIVSSMMDSFSVLMWSILILIIVMYLFSVIILQLIIDSGATDAPHMQLYFGSLFISMFTMYESIVGGINWDDAVHPLNGVSLVSVFLFSVYIAAAIFAVMNMLTGVFVDRAMQCVRESKDHALAVRIREFFWDEEHESLDDAYTWEQFSKKMHNRVMREYLSEMNVNISDKAFFDMLDLDASGAITSEEIVAGCVRLQGNAKALDVALLLREVDYIRADIAELLEAALGRSRSLAMELDTPRTDDPTLS